MKKPTFIIGAVILLIVFAGGVYYFPRILPAINQIPIQPKGGHAPCLKDNEEATWQYVGSRFIATSTNIIIADKFTGEEKFRFQIGDLSPNHGYPYEFRTCGIYVVKEFNWDTKRSKPLPDFSEELWKYNYRGEGMSILTFAGENEKGQPVVDYSYDFRTDFREDFLALIKGYRGDVDNFATLIKELRTMEDIFSLGYNNIISANRNLAGGYFGLDKWTKDSRYFWGRISFTSSVLGFYRIERGIWNVDVLVAPEGTAGGTAFNAEYGYLTYDTGPGWIGVVEVEE